jgi:hypothetical protein
MSSRNGHGAHEAPRSTSRRNILIVAVIALVLVALGGGYLLASGGDDEDAASPSPTVSRSPEPSPSEEPTPTSTESPTASASASDPADPNILDNGRHFVFMNGARSGAAPRLTFDLAEFYQDQAAIDVAAQHGDDAPNGYYIVNDNPRLRTMPVSDDVVVRYIPDGACCDLQLGEFDAFAAAVNGTAQTDYFAQAPWWITVRDGQVVKIEQQYLP